MSLTWKVSADITVLTDPTQVIVKIAEPTVEEPEPETTTEGEEGAEGAATEEAKEGGETTEGETDKTSEAQSEDNKRIIIAPRAYREHYLQGNLDQVVMLS